MVFESFILLENQKTGSSFLVEFFKAFCREPMRRFRKHQPLAVRPPPGKPCLISVRRPADLYASLFNYGLTGRGSVRHALEQQGLGGLYGRTPHHLQDWLEVMLDPRRGPQLDEAYAPPLAAALGFASWRYLRLAAHGTPGAADLASPGAIRRHYAARRIVTHILRNETLSEDLAALVAGPLRHAITDVEAALRHLGAGQRVNASPRAVTAADIPPALLARINAREWFLVEQFYPAEAASQPPG
jgi:hypothetical protein